jgi:hypothetical protein
MARRAPERARAILAPILAAFEADADIPDVARARALALGEGAH